MFLVGIQIHLMVDKTLHGKLKAQHEPTKTEGENLKGYQYNTIILMLIKASLLTVKFTSI
jgi:hypothetical protein